jgi:hypothetical protein
MAKFGELTRNAEDDLLSKLDNSCGGNGIRRFQADELVLVEKERKVSVAGLANGGFSYAVPIDVDAFRRDWEKHLPEVYGRKVDLSGIALPPLRQGFGWGVVRLPELSAQEMFETLTKRFKTYKWCANIDASLNPEKEARTTANGPYVPWFRDRVEADEELKNLSANDLVERGTNCITEPERIALEGWFHWKTGGHLDLKNVTLSAGSRWSDGRVPNAFWSAGSGFYVGRYGVGSREHFIRAREAVSL